MSRLNNSTNAKDLGLSPQSYARLVHQEQKLQNLGQAALFDTNETEDDASIASNQVIITKIKPARKPSPASDCDSTNDECIVTSSKNRPFVHQVPSKQGYSSYSNDDYNFIKKRNNGIKRSCVTDNGRPVSTKGPVSSKSSTAQARSKISSKQMSRPFDDSLFDSSPEGPKISIHLSRVPMADVSNISNKKSKTSKAKRNEVDEEIAGVLLSFSEQEGNDNDKRNKKTSGNVKIAAAKKAKSAADGKSDLAAVVKDKDKWPGGGKKYSNTERLLICKAWVRTSEDRIAGVSMTGADFNKKLHSNYVKLLTKQ